MKTLASTITGCVSVSAFTSWVGFTIGITISAVGWKIWVLRKRRSIIK